MAGKPPIDPLAGVDEPSLPRIRAEHGPFRSDEDLLMFLFMNRAALTNFKKNKVTIRALLLLTAECRGSTGACCIHIILLD